MNGQCNPFEGIPANVLRAENVVRAMLRACLDRVITPSADKAAILINLR